MSLLSYEEVLAHIHSIDVSVSSEERKVSWLTPSEGVGVSRTAAGQIEIFLAGGELKPKSQTVRRALEYQTWHRTSGQPIDASRLILPPVGHFDQVAAFISAELLRCGADTDIQRAFRKVEPIVEMAITKLRLTDQALLGLSGELLLLDAMLRNADDSALRAVMESWNGWRESTRDFSFGAVGVEVKTTTLPRSSHEVQGVHQLERVEQFGAGELERELFLVSVGLDWVSPGIDAGYSIPRLVDSILKQLRDAPGLGVLDGAIASFLDHLSQYGDEQDIGYDHETMSGQAAFSRFFVPRFVRCYDMADPLIEVLRSADVITHHHVDVQSVRFRVELPENVRGALNPVVGVNVAATTILSADELD